MNAPRGIRIAGVALLVGAGMWGCASPMLLAGAGVDAALFGAQVFINGTLESAHIAPLHEVTAATLQTFEDLKFTKVKSTINDRVASIRTMDDSGRTIKVELQRRSESVTRIDIRVGALGDQSMSQLILSCIQSRLPSMPGNSSPVRPSTPLSSTW